MINPRYFLLVIAATALNSCATYDAMRQTPVQYVHPPIGSEDVVEETQVSTPLAIAPLPKAFLRAPRAPKTRYAPPRNIKRRGNSRDTGFLMRPKTLGIPTNDDLKETSTSTQRARHTPGLTVPN